ncbi:MAG: radical SAM protein [bacterium]
MERISDKSEMFDELLLYSSKELRILSCCVLCPRRCGVNRVEGELGHCRTGIKPVVSSYNLHFGEEPPISGENGSGTIFFTYCNLNCIYCQNYPISQLGVGEEVSLNELVGMMLQLQSRGAHNINFVTPSHITIQVIKAVSLARAKGLKIPIVYNTSGYDSLFQLKLLEGTVDIYLADMRYSDNRVAKRYSGVDDYVEVNRKAIKEMHRQVGDLKLDENGIAYKGLLIRHLILPNNLSGSKEIFEFIAKEISRDTYISLMSQYFPAYKAPYDSMINRRITKEEYEKAKEFMFQFGLHNGWLQEI